MSPPRTASIKTESLGTSTIPATAGATSVTTPPRPYPERPAILTQPVTRHKAVEPSSVFFRRERPGAVACQVHERSSVVSSLKFVKATLRNIEFLKVAFTNLTVVQPHVLQEKRRRGVGAACVHAVAAGVVTLLVVRPVRHRGGGTWCHPS